MIRILFVCLGNICRSPMAEYVMKDMIKKEGLETSFHIESKATSREELGNPVYPPARKILLEHGIDCSNHRARQISLEDYSSFDYIIGMDESNIRRLKSFFDDKEGKIIKMLSDRDVADPYYTGDFTKTWEDVNLGCRELLKRIREEKR